ncbi:MAG: hypothetical protein JEY99_07070 [Spirochaetales bacterium]|nr:hypothetical protein [Spirochaetales bacterium]
MKSKLIVFLTVVLLSAGFITGTLFANPQIFEAAEALRVAGDRQAAFDLLEDGLNSAGNNQEKSEFYWRMAETYVNMGDDLEDAGGSKAAIMALFEQGEAYADMAIQADSGNHVAYYMKSANVGRWGQTKGIVSSLFKAGDMKEALILAIRQKENYSNAWNVLSMLYAAVPGRPVSFGNISFAISLSRMAYDSREEEVRAGDEEDMGVGIRKEFALHLWDRDWSASKRRREQNKMKDKYNSTRDLFEKHLYYEGVATIPNMDDRDEALQIMREVIQYLRDKQDKTVDERKDLEELTEILNEWT